MTGFVGEVRSFAAMYVPKGWVLCEGQLLPSASFPDLFSVIGTTFGGDDLMFAVPDLRGRTPVGVGAGPGLTPRVLGEIGGEASVSLTPEQMPRHQHDVRASGDPAAQGAPGGNVWGTCVDGAPYAAPQGSATLAPASLGGAGGNAPHDNRAPVQALTFGLCAFGALPWGDDEDTTIGEIRLWAGTTPRKGWLVCDGSSVPIVGHEPLYALIGTAFGADSTTSFRLPDLRGRVPVHGPDSSSRGRTGGAEEVALTSAHLPNHTHVAHGTSAAATSPSPVNATWATTSLPHYAPAVQVAAAPTGATGGGQPHENMPPYIALSFLIAAEGLFPVSE